MDWFETKYIPQIVQNVRICLHSEKFWRFMSQFYCLKLFKKLNMVLLNKVMFPRKNFFEEEVVENGFGDLLQKAKNRLKTITNDDKWGTSDCY